MLKKGRRGQSAMELLTMVSFFLLFSIPLISIIYLHAAEGAQNASVEQARLAVREIARASDSAYVQGEGSLQRIIVVFPPSVQGISASGKEISMTIQTSSGNSDLVANGIADMRITGKIGTEAGPHRITVQSLGTEIEITEED